MLDYTSEARRSKRDRGRLVKCQQCRLSGYNRGRSDKTAPKLYGRANLKELALSRFNHQKRNKPRQSIHTKTNEPGNRIKFRRLAKWKMIVWFWWRQAQFVSENFVAHKSLSSTCWIIFSPSLFFNGENKPIDSGWEGCFVGLRGVVVCWAWDWDKTHLGS